MPHALGAFLPQVLALLPCKACCSPLRAGRGFGAFFCPRPWPYGLQGCNKPSLCRQGLQGHSSLWPWPYGPARLVTAHFLQAWAIRGILATRPWPVGPKACYSFLPCSQHRPWSRGPARLVTALFLQAGAFGGILATGLGPLAPQGLLQPSPCRWRFLGHSCGRPWPFGPSRLVTAFSVQAGLWGHS